VSYRQLSQEERYTITALLRSRRSHAEIARELQRAPSTICRELARNRNTYDQKYRAEVAQLCDGSPPPRPSRFTLHRRTIQQVVQLLNQQWSPEQIADHIKQAGSFSISHETIYKYVLTDKKEGGTLFTNLRIMPKLRRKRYNSRDSRGRLPGKRHISQRPPEVETRAVLGHWEGDTVIGSDRHHCLLTLLERKSGLVIIRKMESRTAPAVTEAALPAIRQHAANFKTITFDNGTEFHDYEILEKHHSPKCYFSTPYHSWERGSVENVNGLIRQYLPKRTCMRNVTQELCDRIAFRLNTRPRKRHGFRTPLQVYYESSRSLHFKLELRSRDFFSEPLLPFKKITYRASVFCLTRPNGFRLCGIPFETMLFYRVSLSCMLSPQTDGSDSSCRIPEPFSQRQPALGLSCACILQQPSHFFG
jgi:IS30 family transposase